MRAITYQRYGPPEVLRLEDVDVPHLRDGEVLVRVEAASINSWDWDLLRGTFQGRLGFAAFRRPRHRILGGDVAGRVEMVARGVDGLRPGDAVYGDVSAHGWGGFAEFVAAPAEAFAPAPTTLPAIEAAAIPQAGMLALQGLRRRPLHPGDHVLVNGAGGGVGTFAVQLAAVDGVEVTGADRSGKLDAVRRLGATHTVDGERDDALATPARYDLILDVVASRPAGAYRRALRPGGAAVIVGGTTRAILSTLIVGGALTAVSDRRISILAYRAEPDDLVALAGLVDGGGLRPVVDDVFRLEDLPAAFRRFGAGDVIGKLVITP